MFMKELLMSRDMSLNLMDDLPKLGYIAIEASDSGKTIPIAAGFLRLCEGNSVMLDSLITNAKIDSNDRHTILDKLVKRLIKKAKSCGFKQIVAFTKDNNTLVRAETHGFQLLPHSVIVLDLSGA